MALVSYDQVTYLDDNKQSLGYLTIVGAYVLKGSIHDTPTLVDLAVIDPATRTLVIRAGGTDTQHGNSTLIDARRDARVASANSFDFATDRMISNFDAALAQFEIDVHAGKANVHVVNRDGASAHGGGGAVGIFEVIFLLALVMIRRQVGCRA
jgi:rhombotail lipoprotein